MMKMGGNAAFSFRFSFVTEGLGGNAPFFKVFLTIFSVFERQCTVFLTLFGPIFRLGLGRFLGGYAPFYPLHQMIIKQQYLQVLGYLLELDCLVFQLIQALLLSKYIFTHSKNLPMPLPDLKRFPLPVFVNPGDNHIGEGCA